MPIYPEILLLDNYPEEIYLFKYKDKGTAKFTKAIVFNSKNLEINLKVYQ